MQSSKTLNLAAVSRVMLSAHILVYSPDLMSRQRMSLTRDEESCAYNCPRHWTCKLDRNGSVQVNPRALHKHWKKLRSTLQSGILQTVTGCKRRSRLHSHNLSMVQAYRLRCKLVEIIFVLRQSSSRRSFVISKQSVNVELWEVETRVGA